MDCRREAKASVIPGCSMRHRTARSAGCRREPISPRCASQKSHHEPLRRPAPNALPQPHEPQRQRQHQCTEKQGQTVHKSRCRARSACDAKKPRLWLGVRGGAEDLNTETFAEGVVFRTNSIRSAVIGCKKSRPGSRGGRPGGNSFDERERPSHGSRCGHE